MSTPPFQSKLIPYQKELFRKWYKRTCHLETAPALAFRKGNRNFYLGNLPFYPLPEEPS